MDEKLCRKFAADKNFIKFCSIIDACRLKGKELTRPETASLLAGSNVDFVKGDYSAILNAVIEQFLAYPHSLRMSVFHDFFISSLILRDVCEEYCDNEPMPILQYTGSPAGCPCGYIPLIDVKRIRNILMGHISCRKCGLSVSVILTERGLCWDSPSACWEVESGIKEMILLWNQEADKKEDITHRTIRELLEYVTWGGNNSDKSRLSYRLKIYASQKIGKEKSLDSDAAADFLMECREPVQWVEDYLWENMPCKIEMQHKTASGRISR